MAALRLVYQKLASAIFDLEDRFARDRGVRGRHPRPIGDVDFYLSGTVAGGNLRPFASPRKLLVVRNPDGYFIFFDQVEANGHRFQETPPEDTYRLRIVSRFYQIHEQDIALPNASEPFRIDLEPGYAYPFPAGEAATRAATSLLRGTIYNTDGTGMSGVGVEVPGRSNFYQTDASGQWLLIFPDEDTGGTLGVRFHWPDGSTEDVPDVTVTRGQSNNLFQAGLRGFVLSDAGIGIPGAAISVSGFTSESVSRSNGNWFYYFGVNQGAATVDVTARLPDGSSRTRFNVLVRPRAVVVVPSFQIQLVVAY